MSIELKTCPFCGGRAVMKAVTLHMKCSVRMLVPIIDRKLKERGL